MSAGNTMDIITACGIVEKALPLWEGWASSWPDADTTAEDLENELEAEIRRECGQPDWAPRSNTPQEMREHLDTVRQALETQRRLARGEISLAESHPSARRVYQACELIRMAHWDARGAWPADKELQEVTRAAYVVAHATKSIIDGEPGRGAARVQSLLEG